MHKLEIPFKRILKLIFTGGLVYEVGTSRYIVGVLSASGSKCYSHVPSLFAFVGPNLAWIKRQLERDENEEANQSSPNEYPDARPNERVGKYDISIL